MNYSYSNGWGWGGEKKVRNVETEETGLQKFITWKKMTSD